MSAVIPDTSAADPFVLQRNERLMQRSIETSPPEEQRRSRNPGLGFLTGLAIGAAIWWLSPLITGRQEPWDAGKGYYEGALFGAGLLGGLLLPGHSRWFVAGIFVGQVLVLLGAVLRAPSSGGLWPLGVVFLALYSLLALLGAAVGVGVRGLRSRRTL